MKKLMISNDILCIIEVLLCTKLIEIINIISNIFQEYDENKVSFCKINFWQQNFIII